MWISAVITAFLVTFLLFKIKWIHIMLKTYKRDIRLMWIFARLVLKLRFIQKKNLTVPSIFTSLAKKHPQKVAFLFEDSSWTFSQIEDFSNKISRFFGDEGFKKGDCIGLILENTPEYPAIWLGLSKIGVVTALINTNLKNNPLMHSIEASRCKSIIFGTNSSESVKTIEEQLKTMKLYQFHENTKEICLPKAIDLREKLQNVSEEPVENNFGSVTDPLLYIYTSGTTGLPKAAAITHLRYTSVVFAGHYACSLNNDDIVYNPLPLYHSAGGMLGVGQAILSGKTVALRKKFSASNYWTDCAKYNCTIAQYIGEICRYILASAQEEPIKHKIRAVMGNGLRIQIWKEFMTKFNIDQIYEFYGSTEGISNIINIDNTVGSIGFIPVYLRYIYPVILIRCDETTGKPLRNKKGFCMECGTNEPGLFVAKIDQKLPVFSFKGYSDEKATQQKIIHGVLKSGDMFFNSGDVLSRDELGNYYFRDRMGDTFRWKGENVSTNEIEAVISNVVQLNDAVVYGVQIPGTEGRAGMVAVVDTNKNLDLDVLSAALKTQLPTYAIPLFIRVMESVPLTGTYKLKKVDLQSEGFNIHSIRDKLYFYNVKLKIYEELTKELYEEIINEKIRL